MSYPGWEMDFERVSGYLQEALGYTGNTHTLDNVRQGIADGVLQLWPAVTSALVTELILYPTGLKVVNFFLAGGNLDEVRSLYPIALGWARSQGCTRATFTGRRGWERTFLTREEGWSPSLTYFTKEL
jgi:hypothetical protein